MEIKDKIKLIAECEVSEVIEQKLDRQLERIKAEETRKNLEVD